MDLREWRRRLHVATVGRDMEEILTLLTEGQPTECLQAIGGALLAAQDQDPAATERCTAALRGRGWDGDTELANALDARLGGAAATKLKPLRVDLEALGELLDRSPGEEGFVDLTTGMVWSGDVLENARDAGLDDLPDIEDSDRCIPVVPGGHGSRDMRAFIATIDHPDVAERLERAVQGKGAFRRFRQELDRFSLENSRWHAFSDDRRVGRARAWLAGAGFRPAP